MFFVESKWFFYGTAVKSPFWTRNVYVVFVVVFNMRWNHFMQIWTLSSSDLLRSDLLVQARSHHPQAETEALSQAFSQQRKWNLISPRSFIWAQHQSAGCRGIKALIFDIVRVICIHENWENISFLSCLPRLAPLFPHDMNTSSDLMSNQDQDTASQFIWIAVHFF